MCGALEGATGWADTTMMHAKAASSCAYMWMEIRQSQASGDGGMVCLCLPFSPPAKGNELLRAEGCKTSGLDNFDKIGFGVHPFPTVAAQNACPTASGWKSISA